MSFSASALHLPPSAKQYSVTLHKTGPGVSASLIGLHVADWMAHGPVGSAPWGVFHYDE